MKTWRNCAWKTTSLSNQSAQRCSTEWVSLIYGHKCSMLHVCPQSVSRLLLCPAVTSFFPFLIHVSSRVQRGSGSRNWPPGSAVTSRGLWNRLKTGRKKTRASTPSYWYQHGREIKMGKTKRAAVNASQTQICASYFIQEAESKPQCRRLQLKDIIPTEMQRLTKYPLLLENIAKNTGVFVIKILSNWFYINIQIWKKYIKKIVFNFI